MEDRSPSFVKKAYHPRALFVFVVLLVRLACFCDLSGVVLSADRIYSPKAGTVDCLALVSEPLTVECVYRSVEVFVSNVLS